MALTVKITKRDRDGQSHRTYANVTFDSSMAAGGESLTPGMLGFSKAVTEVRVSGATGYKVEYDYATKKLIAYQMPAAATAGPLQGATGVDLSAVTVRVVATGY